MTIFPVQEYLRHITLRHHSAGTDEPTTLYVITYYGYGYDDPRAPRSFPAEWCTKSIPLPAEYAPERFRYTLLSEYLAVGKKY